MSLYTVVLLYPDYLCEDTPYGQEVYVAHVEAEGSQQAVVRARREAFEANEAAISSEDFALCVMFAGHQTVELFGWQL